VVFNPPGFYYAHLGLDIDNVPRIREAIGMTEPMITSVDLVKYFEKQFTILAVFEDGLFLIAAGRDGI
jgi:hypothetical protein